jgi:hypothetical protein
MAEGVRESAPVVRPATWAQPARPARTCARETALAVIMAGGRGERLKALRQSTARGNQGHKDVRVVSHAPEDHHPLSPRATTFARPSAMAQHAASQTRLTALRSQTRPSRAGPVVPQSALQTLLTLPSTVTITEPAPVLVPSLRRPSRTASSRSELHRPAPVDNPTHPRCAGPVRNGYNPHQPLVIVVVTFDRGAAVVRRSERAQST